MSVIASLFCFSPLSIGEGRGEAKKLQAKEASLHHKSLTKHFRLILVALLYLLLIEHH